MAGRGVFWFRRDLRAQDHPLLSLALRDCQELSFVYVLDPRELKPHPQLEIHRLGRFRRQFLLECLQDLQAALKQKGHKLYFFVSDPVEVFPALCQQYGFRHLYCSDFPASDETLQLQMVTNALKGQTQVHHLWHSTIIDQIPHPLPPIFTDFRLAVEPTISSRPLQNPEPTRWPSQVTIHEGKDFQIVLGPPSDQKNINIDNWLSKVFRFRGGENNAVIRLEDYIWNKDLLRTYKETRNQMLGEDYSTKFSPWLALGCLSPKRILHEIQLYEKTRTSNESTYWLKFELLWRDFFYCQFQQHGARVFRFKGVQRRPQDHRKGSFADQLHRWKQWSQASTGQPFVDAILNELNSTGFVSNRGRQIAASYLIHDLGVDWRWGAQYFESLLIDYDPCINYGNWAYLAGVGADPRPIRRFDPLRQAELYDENGDYVKFWSGPATTPSARL